MNILEMSRKRKAKELEELYVTELCDAYGDNPLARTKTKQQVIMELKKHKEQGVRTIKDLNEDIRNLKKQLDVLNEDYDWIKIYLMKALKETDEDVDALWIDNYVSYLRGGLELSEKYTSLYGKLY